MRTETFGCPVLFARRLSAIGAPPVQAASPDDRRGGEAPATRRGTRRPAFLRGTIERLEERIAEDTAILRFARGFEAADRETAEASALETIAREGGRPPWPGT